jgi:hypothetical protein
LGHTVTTGALMTKRKIEVAELLARYPDGLTVNEIYCRSKSMAHKTIRNALNEEPRWAYIDRWVLGKKNYEPVWCLNPAPENCPPPNDYKS